MASVNRPEFHEVLVVGDTGGTQYTKHRSELLEALGCVVALRQEHPWNKDRCPAALTQVCAVAEKSPTKERHASLAITEVADSIAFNCGIASTTRCPVETGAAIRRFEAFRAKFCRLWELVHSGPLRSVCEDRLSVLRHRFELSRGLNADYEDNHHRVHGGGDIHAAAKVDIRRIGTSMTVNTLLSLVRRVAVCERDRVLYRPKATDSASAAAGDGVITLGTALDEFYDNQPAEQRGITAESLCVSPNYYHTTYKRFDVFEKGQPLRPRADAALKLLRHFLKYQWGDNGTYLAQLVRETVEGMNAVCDKQFLELELTVHGLRAGELQMLGEWVVRHGFDADPRIRFVIRIVQRHHRDKRKDQATPVAQGFDDVLQHLFVPMLQAVVNPSGSPAIAALLRRTVAISGAIDHHGESRVLPHSANPSQYSGTSLPPDAFFLYYVAQNLVQVNQELVARELSPLHFRIHAEANHHGPAHCVAALLLADTLLNPVVFSTQPAVEYLAYLLQLPIVMSPSHSNATGMPFHAQPLLSMHKAGLNVSLATLDPLHFHESRQSLDEEYRTAAKNNYMSSPDLCEMALRSVLCANYSTEEKVRLVGKVAVDGAAGNQFLLSQVPTLRLILREQCWRDEQRLLTTVRPGAGGSATGREQLQEAPHAIEPYVRFPRIVIRGPSLVADDAAAEGTADALLPSHQHEHSVRKGAIAGDVVRALQLRLRWTQIGGRAGNIYHTLYHPAAAQSDAAINVGVSRTAGVGGGVGAATHDGGLALRRRGPASTVTPTLDALEMHDGVFKLRSWHPRAGHPRAIPSYVEYREAYRAVAMLAHNPTAQVFARRRLEILRHKFELHCALVEHESEKSVRDFSERGDPYRCVKVDNHIHMASGVTGKDLLDFIIEKLQKHSDDIIMLGDRGEPITLGHFFANVLRIGVDELSVAALDVQADRSTFNRFDQFNEKYNPLKLPLLRTLFLKTDNFMQGRYFAELIRRTFARQAEDGTTFTECRLSIYGKTKNEWADLARWFVTHGMSSSVNRWMIQLPRLFHVYKASGIISSFDQLLRNFFEPLWEATLHPEQNPFLAHLLANISGFDSVDNENAIETEVPGVTPEEWTRADNPSYSYWAFYAWANITSLNQYRGAKGLNTFTFRPHCGESGDPDHLIDGFLLADGINHGINLRHRPVLAYLYYCAQIGLSITPLSNNALFCPYNENPFPQFFRCGMNVALATDGPLQFHHTQQPLIEEYGIAAKVWKLSTTDTSEIAMNSVRQSGFPLVVKQQWLGPLCMLSSSTGNDPRRTHTPDVRIAFRFEVYHEEVSYLENRGGVDVDAARAMPQPVEEEIVMAEIAGKPRSALVEDKRRLSIGRGWRAKL